MSFSKTFAHRIAEMEGGFCDRLEGTPANRVNLSRALARLVERRLVIREYGVIRRRNSGIQ